MRLRILAEGAGWVVVNKPPGLVVHPNEWVGAGGAVLQHLRRQLGRWVYPIHRLDKGVSGCLLFATDQARAGALSTAFADARKGYVALVRGAMEAAGPLRVETPMTDSHGVIREAASTVWVLGSAREPRCSLVRVEPHTGRYHQVRRHVRDLHHPILGDAQHGDHRVNREWRETRGLERIALHCLTLHVPLPEGELAVLAPLWPDQRRLYAALPFWGEAVAACPDLASE